MDGERGDSSRPVRGLIPGTLTGRGWMRWGGGSLVAGQMVNDMTGLLYFRLGDMAPLSSQPCPKHPASAQDGRGWYRKLMEAVTNHKICDTSTLGSEHANNLERVSIITLSLQHEGPGHLKNAVLQL